MHPRLRLLVTLLALLGATAITTAQARESRSVDRFTLTVGFDHEPAIQADTNGIWLQVTDGETPITGLESTLTATVSFGGADSRALPLLPDPDQPGVYRGVFIPMQPGAYAFTIGGSIQGTAVDETFTSGEGGVASVEPRAGYEFPSAAHGMIRTMAMPLVVTTVGLGLAIGYLRDRRDRR